MRPEMTSKWKSNREKNKKIVGKPLTFAIAKLVGRAITFRGAIEKSQIFLLQYSDIGKNYKF